MHTSHLKLCINNYEMTTFGHTHNVVYLFIDSNARESKEYITFNIGWKYKFIEYYVLFYILL